jgi:hypothetical protein
MEAIFAVFILIGLIASHGIAYRIGVAIGERRQRSHAKSSDSVL